MVQGTTNVVAIEIFHHPAGVLLPGEVAQLPADDAARGIALGALVPAQPEPVVDTTPSSKTEE